VKVEDLLLLILPGLTRQPDGRLGDHPGGATLRGGS